MNKEELENNDFKIINSNKVLQQKKQDIILKLKELLPNVINSDNILNIQVLQDLLDISKTTSNNQGYELTFAGKGFAKAKTDQPTTKELKVEIKQSKNFNTTENIIIRGDNIDVLKILKQNYHEKIKMIYIDPPYNTKNEDFLYSDNFKISEEELIEELGLSEDTKNYLQNVYGTKAHSAWLSFMLPRLILARDLLTKDGVIFISIDDNEQAGLKLLCDEVFGEENLILCTIRNISDGNNIGKISVTHEYVLIYKKNIMPELYITANKNDNIDTRLTKNGNTKSIIKFPKGLKSVFNCFKEFEGVIGGNSELIKIIGKMIFDNGELQNDVELEAEWAMPNILKKLFNNEKVFDNKGQEYLMPYFTNTGVPHLYKTRNGGIFRSVRIWNNATNEVNELFGGKKVFNNPKTIEMLKTLIKLVLQKNDIVLDFFAGSGTTAHAVIDLNKEDNGNRKFILVQWDELINEKKNKVAYDFCKNEGLVDKRNGEEPYISDITIERVNRAGNKIKNELEEKRDLINNSQNIDIGYKVFSLVEKPKIEYENGQFELFNKRQSILNTLYNMMAVTCVSLSSKIQEAEKDKLYFVNNCYYVVDKFNQNLIDKDKQVYVDGYCNSINLAFMLNLKETFDNDNVKVVY